MAIEGGDQGKGCACSVFVFVPLAGEAWQSKAATRGRDVHAQSVCLSLLQESRPLSSKRKIVLRLREGLTFKR